MNSQSESNASEVYPFLKASTAARDFTVVSRIERAIIHWGYFTRGGRLCGGPNCAACREGMKPENRWILRLEESRSSSYLFEARPRLQASIAEIALMQQRGESALVRIWRAGSAPNHPIDLDILRAVSFPQLFCVTRLISRVYEPAMLIREAQNNTVSQAPSGLGHIQDTGFEDSVFRTLEDSGFEPGDYSCKD